jgi:branched-chain amino acid transport system permease protein
LLEYLFKHLEPITHGASGLLVRPLTIFGYPLASDRSVALLSIVLLLMSWLVCSAIAGSHLGRCFIVVRESEIVARGMGINVARTKLYAFVISGSLAGIAGAVFAFASRLAHPETFSLSMSIDYVAMIVVGGLGSAGGALLGAGFVTIAPESLQRVGEALNLSDRVFAIREIVFGALIILFLIFEPSGLRAIVHRLGSRGLQFSREMSSKIKRRKLVR